MDERKIIIGLITSTDYCKAIKEFWNYRFIQSQSARLISRWCWEYYDRYKEAPAKDIEGIYHSKLKEGKLQKAVSEDMEEILLSLSDESVEDPVNLNYLVEETEKYFNEQNLTNFTASVESLAKTGKTEEAEKFISEYKPIYSKVKKLDDFILTSKQIKNKERPASLSLMRPWLKEGELTILYGGFGTGKSLLSIHVAYVLGSIDFEEEKCDIAKWQVMRNTGCLYVDGELGELEMEDRIRKFEWLGKQPPQYKLRVFSIPEYQLATEDTFYLSQRVNQAKIIHWLKEHPTYKFIVLDSASTLFGLQNENDNSEVNNKINPFLRDLRALKVSTMLLHHSGKDFKRGLRGASSMGAMAQNIFRLEQHPQKAIDKGEAWFTLKKDKQRKAGKMFKEFSLHYFQNDEETETNFEETENY